MCRICVFLFNVKSCVFSSLKMYEFLELSFIIEDKIISKLCVLILLQLFILTKGWEMKYFYIVCFGIYGANLVVFTSLLIVFLSKLRIWIADLNYTYTYVIPSYFLLHIIFFPGKKNSITYFINKNNYLFLKSFYLFSVQISSTKPDTK